MSREDGPPPPAGADEAAPAPPTTSNLELLEQLTALANRALDAMRTGDITAVNALLTEREPFLARLATALARSPSPEPRFSTLAQRDIDALEELERGIAKARIQVAGELDVVAVAHATVSRYADDAPLATPPTTIDIRR